MSYTQNMTMEDLEQAVLDIVRKAYCREYVGKLKVSELKDGNNVVGYHLTLGLNNIDKPVTINIEGSTEVFLKGIEQELRKRHLHYSTYSFGYKTRN